MYNIKNSKQLFEHARTIIPGGVNSPVRAFKSVGGTPPFCTRGEGSQLYDADDNAYTDYVCSWGAIIVGHAHPAIIQATQAATEKGLSFGAPTELETQLAEKICEHVASIEMVRMVNSGTEATMSAIRLARGYTRRNKIIKFDGCYHGHSDALLAGAGSGVSTLSIPGSLGVPLATVADTIVLEFNNTAQLQETVTQHTSDIACIIVEPIAGNMNLVPAHQSFIQTMRELCDTYHIVLIFDEVMSGFRVGLGGAQTHFAIYPDLTTLAKVIGGGLPVGAFGGKREIMCQLAPEGQVYQAGTLSGNPIAMTAGLKTLEIIEQANFFTHLSEKNNALCTGLTQCAQQYDLPFNARACGGMFGIFFTEKQVHTLVQAQQADEKLFQAFHHGMLERGFYFAPSRFEAGFITAAHTQQDIDNTLSAADEVMKKLSP